MISWFRRLGRCASAQTAKRGVSDRGMLLFPSTGEVIRAESVLREAGLVVAVKGPPAALRQGCDMVVEFALVEELRVREILENHRLSPLQVAVVEDHLLEPVSLFHVKELGEFFMVRAANMKVTVHRPSGRIVNVSGGGCPDVPYLAEALVGCTLDDAPEPRSLGRTLCGYALQLAFAEAQRRCRG